MISQTDATESLDRIRSFGPSLSEGSYMKEKSEKASLVVLVSISTLVILFILGLFLTGFVYEKKPNTDIPTDQEKEEQEEEKRTILYLEF